ncbi:BglG family transcription antiterminator [Risungbinella massiliensis]|uniref:BglG family transcription antiterminator n=1 Tax=Risungbinella massiliensis TaxID=1329796 RepID=UPI0005CC3E24|nr:BglG family transcription antiterminator [Risungbinella massiliensis]
MLDQRASTLLHFLITHRTMTIKRLEKELNCSRRQITYDLQKINVWLTDEGLPPIRNERAQGLVVDASIQAFLSEKLPKVDDQTYTASPEERRDLILIKTFMSPEYLSVNHFTSLLKVSRNTTLTTIKQAAELAALRNVKLDYSRTHGYQFIGDELEIRRFMMRCVSKFIRYPEGVRLLQNVYDADYGKDSFQTKYDRIYMLLKKAEQLLSVTYIEEKMKEVASFLVFLTSRIRNDQKVEYPFDMKEVIYKWEEFQSVSCLVSTLGITPDSDEHLYVAMTLLGLQVKDGELPLHEPVNHNTLFALTKAIIQEFEILACVSIPQKEKLANSLYLHIKPAYYRLLFHIPLVNPLLAQIQEEYADLFVLVKRSLKLLEEYVKRPMSDEEAGYITLHFGSFVDPTDIQLSRKNAVIVCPNGIGASNMLKYQIEKLIPEVDISAVLSLSEYDFEKEDEYDLLFSTVSFQTSKPLIIVNPILTALDKARILQEVDFHLLKKTDTKQPSVNQIMEIVKLFTTIHDERGLYETLTDLLTGSTVAHFRRYKPVIRDLLKIEMIQIKDRVENWQEAVRFAAAPMLDIQAINPEYIEAMIENIENLGPYVVIAPHVAIPHARPEQGVKKLSMSLLKLNEPVSFTSGGVSKDAQLIFVLAAVDNESHLKALSQLTELLEEEENIDEMLNITKPEGFLPLIQTYSER